MSKKKKKKNQKNNSKQKLETKSLSIENDEKEVTAEATDETTTEAVDDSIITTDIKADGDDKAVDSNKNGNENKTASVSDSDTSTGNADVSESSTSTGNADTSESATDESAPAKAKKEKEENGWTRYFDGIKEGMRLEKEAMSEMETKREKIGYFLYYHKWHMLVGLVIIVALVYTIFTVVTSKDSVYYMVVVNDSYNTTFQEVAAEEVSEVVDYNEKKEKINIAAYSTDISSYESGYYGGDNGMQGIYSLMLDGLIDTYVMEKDEFEWFAEDDNFCDLKTVLPSDVYEELEDYMVYAKDSSGESKALGLDISSTDFYKESKSNLTHPEIAISNASSHLEESIDFIEYIYGLSDGK